MDKVRDWLASIELEKYGDIFEEKGWDDMDTVTTMSENDIQTVVTKPGHVRKITVAIQKLKDQEKLQNVQEKLPDVPNLPEVQKLPKVKHVIPPQISSLKDDITDQNSKSTIQNKHQPIKTNQDEDIQRVSICTIDNTGFVEATLTNEKENNIANPNKETELQTEQDRDGERALRSVAEMGDLSDADDEICNYSHDVLTQLPSRHVMSARKDPIIAQMNAFSSSSITTTTIVKDSKNVTIADKVEVHEHTDGSQDNFKGQINSVIRNYQRTEHLFVKTRSFQEVSDILEDRNVAIIAGNPGYGKSTMAYHQMLEHSNIGYEPIIVTSVADWKSMIEGKNNNKQIVMIDDIFGSLSVDERMLSEWSLMFDLIEILVRERKSSLKVICTTRKYIMSQVFTKIKRYKIFEKLYTVDMADDQFKLLETEKTEMLTKYFQHYKIEIKQTIINAVLRVASDYGFPHCVEMYCTRTTLRKRGVAFFETPLEFLEKEIDNLVEYEKDSFCSLLMVLLSEDNGFNITDLDNSDTDIQTISNALKLSRMPDNTFLPGFVNVFKLLKDVFVKEIDDGVYTFKHDSFKEIISVVTFKFHPATSMQLLSLKMIVEKTKYFTYKPSSLEMAAILPKSCTRNLMKRFNDEIEEGNSRLVSKHHAWNENDFIQKWLDTIKRLPEFLVTCFQTSRYQDKIKLGFLSCLCKNKKEQTVLSILQDKGLKRALQHTDLVKELSIALVYASDFDCSEELLDSLIENGADVNGTFTDNLKVFEELFENSILAFELMIFIRISIALGRAICCDNLEKCRYLIDKGASLFNLGFQGRNIIHIAADKGSTKCLQYILNYVNSSKIPQVNITTNDFKTIECLYGERYSTFFCNSYAHGLPSGFLFFEYRYFSSVKAIHCIQTPETYEMLSKEHTMVEPIYSICLPNQNKVIDSQYNGPIPQPEVYYEHSRMPLLIYLFLNRKLTPELINKLVERGHDVNKKYRDKSFMFFAGMTNIDYPNDCITLLQTLYSHGLDINATDRFGKTAMSFILSCYTDVDIEVCEWLLEMNADPNIPDNKGCVPLFYALECCQDILLELLERTEHVGNLISHNGRTCFHYLAGNCEIDTKYVEHIIPLLLKENIDINHLDNKGISALTLTNKNTIGPFLKHGAYPNIKDDNGMTPGMHLVLNASESSKYNGPPPRIVFFHAHDDLYLKIQILQKHGMHVSAKDSRERNLIHFILQSDLKDSLKVDVVDLLCRHSCEINEKDDTGIVPIMLAVRNQTCGTPLFDHLIERGANVSYLDNNGQSVLDHCLEGSMEDIQKSEFIKMIISTKGFIRSYITSIPYALTEHNKIHTLCTFFNCVCLKKQNIGHVFKQILTSQIADDLKAMVIKICIDNSEDSSFHEDEIESHLLKTILKSTILLKVFIRYDLINLDMYSSTINLEMLPNEDENANEVLNILEENGVCARKHLSCYDDTLVEMKLVKEGKYTTFKSMLKYWDENKALCQDSKGNTVLHYLAMAKTEDSIVKDIVEQICQKTEIQTIQNKKGETALHVLCQTKPFKQETISLLIRHSQSVNTNDKLGKSAF